MVNSVDWPFVLIILPKLINFASKNLHATQKIEGAITGVLPVCKRVELNADVNIVIYWHIYL